MVENSKIEWTTHTFNPWIGCAKVSAGCQHCYAETLMDTRYGRVEWGENGTRVLTSDANWRKPHKWHGEALDLQSYHSANLSTDAERPRVFCASLADVFEDREELVPWLARLTMLIEQCWGLDWLLLTKRPQHVMSRLAKVVTNPVEWLTVRPHVWIGTSVENQATAEERIPHLLKIPAAVRFLSMEPLLGPVELWNLKCGDQFDAEGPRYYDALKGFAFWPNGDFGIHGPQIHWVIVGGESGQNARPMNPAWVWSIRNECQRAGTPFFFKQWGEWVPRHSEPMKNEPILPLYDDGRHGVFDDKGQWHVNEGEWSRYDNLGGQVMYRVGKAKAGRILNGRVWSEFPKT